MTSLEAPQTNCLMTGLSIGHERGQGWCILIPGIDRTRASKHTISPGSCFQTPRADCACETT